MRFVLLILIALLLISGCSKKVTEISRVENSDSTHVVESFSFEDTTVVVPADSAKVTALVIEGELPEIKVESGRARVKVSVKKGVLTAEANCDSLEAQLKILQRERETYRDRRKVEYHKVVVPERYVPWPTKCLAWVGGSALLGLLIYLARKFT